MFFFHLKLVLFLFYPKIVNSTLSFVPKFRSGISNAVHAWQATKKDAEIVICALHGEATIVGLLLAR